MNIVNASVIGLALSVSVNSFAACDAGGKNIFYCQTAKGKKIEVCDLKKTILYAYGPLGKNPEILLNVPRDEASTVQWEGFGSSHTNSVTIPNGKTTYTVFSGVKQKNGEMVGDAGVEVSIDNKHAATVQCIDKNFSQDLEGISLRKTPN